MPETLRILMLEDSSIDAEIVHRLLNKEYLRCIFHLAMTEECFMEELDSFHPDVILADNSLPQFDAIEALRKVRQLHSQIPFIMITGAMSEEFAANIIKSGADDYILKDRLVRLPAAIDAAIKKRKVLKSIVDYRYALDQSAIVSITDRKGTIIYANDNFCKISKYTSDELVGKDHCIVNSGYHPASFIKNLWVTIANGKIWSDEICNKAKDGSLYWVDTHIIPFLDEREKPYQYMAIRMDITKRKKVEEKLQTAYKRLSFHITNAPLGFIEWDDHLHAKYWSKHAEDIFGWTEKEFISMQKDAFSQVYEEDVPIVRRTVEDLISGKVSRNSVQHRNYTKDGSVIWCEWFNSVLIDKDGNSNTILSLVRDITEPKKIELAIILSEHKLNKAQELAHIGNWDVDLLENTDIWSDELYRIYGLSKGEIKPSLEQFLLFVHPEDLKSVQNKIQESFDAVCDSSVNFRFIRKDGVTRYAFIEWKYEFDERGNPVRLFGILQDITERKKAELEIKESNERFELVVNATNDIIWDWDIITDKFWWNKNYYSHFGYNEQNTLLNITSWQDGIHPGDKKRVLSGLSVSLKNHQNFWTDEYRFLKADHSIAFVMDCGYILYTEEDKKPYRMVGAMLDITERKKAEKQLIQNFDEKQIQAERMSTILNALPANIALLDEKGIIIDVNKGWKQFSDDHNYHGRNIGDDYIKIVQDEFSEDKTDCKAAALGIKNVLKNKTREFVCEYPFYSAGIRRWFRMVVTPLQEKNYSGAVIMHIDISELRKLEQERLDSKIEEQKNLANAILNAQEKERSSIGEELHDNVNQILAGTNLFLSIAKKNQEKNLEHIESSMHNIQQAIQANRKIAHELVSPGFDEIQLVELIGNLSENMLKKIGIRVDMETTKLNEDLLNNEQKLSIYRIAQEQCTNITKYAEAKTATISLSTTEGVFKMVIADDGKGMAAGKKISGIGLRNVKGRTNILNGTTHIITEQGKGFSLEISIPL
jgi:PAS domain S-box-containing protein